MRRLRDRGPSGPVNSPGERPTLGLTGVCRSCFKQRRHESLVLAGDVVAVPFKKKKKKGKKINTTCATPATDAGPSNVHRSRLPLPRTGCHSSRHESISFRDYGTTPLTRSPPSRAFPAMPDRAQPQRRIDGRGLRKRHNVLACNIAGSSCPVRCPAAPRQGSSATRPPTQICSP